MCVSLSNYSHGTFYTVMSKTNKVQQLLTTSQTSNIVHIMVLYILILVLWKSFTLVNNKHIEREREREREAIDKNNRESQQKLLDSCYLTFVEVVLFSMVSISSLNVKNFMYLLFENYIMYLGYNLVANLFPIFCYLEVFANNLFKRRIPRIDFIKLERTIAYISNVKIQVVLRVNVHYKKLIRLLKIEC